MDIGKLLPTLKHKLVTGTNFSDVMRWFFDDIANDPDFLTMGEPTSDKTVIEALGSVARRIAGLREDTVMEAMLFRLPEAGFIHGAVTLGAWLGTVFYFEDIERGLLVLGDAVGPTHFGRFTLVKTPTGRSFTLN